MTTQQQTKFNILLIGDACEDIYTYGHVNRISPEAPVPVFEPKYTIEREGMGGNVAKNLEALGCTVNFLHGEKSVKNRLIDIRTKQHLVRLDKDIYSEPVVFETDILPGYDAIVVSDYNKGTVSYELLEKLRREFSGPIFVDTKKTDLSVLEGCFIKINELEYSRVTSLPNGVPSGLIVTMGRAGAMYNDELFPAEHVEVTDVCGAGDTFLAALAYKFLDTNSIETAIKFAIKASTVTVQRIGVYAPTLEEIK